MTDERTARSLGMSSLSRGVEATQLDGARALLAALRSQFERHIGALARACALDGALDAALVDARQLACYEVALANADLLAAETVLPAHVDREDEVDTRLALLFATDAIVAVLQRLDALGLELGLDPAPLAVHGDDAT